MISADVQADRRRVSAAPAANASSHSCEGTILSSFKAHATIAASLGEGRGQATPPPPLPLEEEKGSWWCEANPVICSELRRPRVHLELGLSPNMATAKVAFASSWELKLDLDSEDDEGEGKGGLALHGSLASTQPSHRCWLEIQVRRVMRRGSVGLEFESWGGIILAKPRRALESSWGLNWGRQRVAATMKAVSQPPGGLTLIVPRASKT